MDDLADEAGVSRRTLFNHVPGKVDSIIGTVPDFPPDALETFHAAGPTGRLLDDLRVLAKALLEDDTLDFDRELMTARREVLTTNPRLLVLVHERFEQVSSALVDHILVREGQEFGRPRARLLVRLLVALFDHAIDGMVAESDGPSVADLFDATVDDARTLLA